MMGMLRPLHPKNMAKHVSSNEARLRRHQRIRRSLTGTETRPRLNVFRSGEHIYAQLINDSTGNTIVSASSLDESIRDFKASQSTQRAKEPSSREQANSSQTVAEVANNAPVQEQEARPASARSGQQKGSQQQKGGQQKGGQQQKGGGNRPAPAKTVLPTAQKGAKKTPVEALAPIASNRKVAIAREVGKLVAQRAKEKGVTTIVFDRGGYSYHGRVASLAEGAREAGLNF